MTLKARAYSYLGAFSASLCAVGCLYAGKWDDPRTAASNVVTCFGYPSRDSPTARGAARI